MKVLVSGSSGLVGTSLVAKLQQHGHEVSRLVRRATSRENSYQWNPKEQQMDPHALDNQDAVVHLGGENLLGLWTKSKKQEIRDSRVESTALLAKEITKREQPPKVLINASAIGYYGNRGDEILTEESEPGEGFLAEVCRSWEAATHQAQEAGTRVVRLRIGLVLDRKGGAIPKMLLPFKLALGGKIGSGEQYMSWISLEDLTSVILFLLNNDISGPVNAVAPHPVMNKEFTKTLGKVLGRPTPFPMPAFLLRMLAKEMAEEMLLTSTRVEPRVLLDNGYSFAHQNLEDALRDILKRGKE